MDVNTVFAYAEIAYIGRGYKLNHRIFNSLSDAEGCMLMYLKSGGFTTELTRFVAVQEDIKLINKYVSRHYKATELALSGNWELEDGEGRDYHANHFLPLQLDRESRKDLNKVYQWIESGFDSQYIPIYKTMQVAVKTGEDVQNVILQASDKEVLEDLLGILKSNGVVAV